jgi:integrase
LERRIMSRKTLPGIRDKRSGRQAYVRVRGKLITKMFPADAPDSELIAWHEEQRAAAPREATDDAPVRGSFAADVAADAPRVAAKPTAGQIAAHLALWIAELGGDRPTRSITTREIDAVIQRWQVTATTPEPGKPGRPSDPDGLRPGTIRKRIGNLRAFLNRTLGKSASNPVRGSAIPKPPKPEIRGLDYATIERILAAMPRELDAKPGTVPVRSFGYLRAAVMAYTSLTPAMIKKLRPGDLRFEADKVHVRERLKGGGVEPRTLELTAHGVAALRAFHEADAYGNYCTQTVNLGFKRAAKRIGLDPTTIHQYDLRHSFGAEMYRTTGDLATVGRFMMHAAGSTITARYAAAANAAVDRAAASAFLAGSVPPAAEAAPVKRRKVARRKLPEVLTSATTTR